MSQNLAPLFWCLDPPVTGFNIYDLDLTDVLYMEDFTVIIYH